MKSLDSSQRFFRPMDVGHTRRNHRQVQARRVLIVFANVLLMTGAVLSILWLYRRTQDDVRFAVRRIEATGSVHTPAAAIRGRLSQYMGRNLFRIEIDEVSRQVSRLPWVRSVAVEKQLPGTLVVHVAERRPSAIDLVDGSPWYVDEDGVAFAPMTPAIGDPHLPLIDGGSPDELADCVAFVVSLRKASPALYSRVSEVRPAGVGGFEVFDRDLQSWIRINAEDAAERWETLYRLMASEGMGRRSIEYADLRFRDRIVIRPRALPGPMVSSSTNAFEVTN